MFKVNNKVTRTTPLALTFIVNFEHISHLVLVFLLLTLNMQLPAGKKSLWMYSSEVAAVIKIVNAVNAGLYLES